MAAAKLDIVLEEDSNFYLKIEYYDENGNMIDMTNYGAAVIFARDKETDYFYRGSVADGVISVLGNSGTIIIDIPTSEINNVPYQRGLWELYIYKTINDPTDSPKRLVEGKFVYSKSLL